MIGEWLAGGSPGPLHEYLGMTPEEYAAWTDRRMAGLSRLTVLNAEGPTMTRDGPDDDGR